MTIQIIIVEKQKKKTKTINIIGQKKKHMKNDSFKYRANDFKVSHHFIRSIVTFNSIHNLYQPINVKCVVSNFLFYMRTCVFVFKFLFSLILFTI